MYSIGISLLQMSHNADFIQNCITQSTKRYQRIEHIHQFILDISNFIDLNFNMFHFGRQIGAKGIHLLSV